MEGWAKAAVAVVVAVRVVGAAAMAAAKAGVAATAVHLPMHPSVQVCTRRCENILSEISA